MGRPLSRLALAWPVVSLAATGALSFIVAGSALGALTHRDATRAATSEARDLTITDAEATVAPALEDGLLTENRSSLARLDHVVRNRVLSHLVVRTKVWAPDGTILYSDVPALIGRHFELGPRELWALRTGTANADVSDLAEPENVYERRFGKLLEVYDGVRTRGGRPVLFEAYLRYGSIASATSRIFTALLPGLLIGLTALFLFQIPLAWALTRRIVRGRAQEERLLKRALEASEVERRHIAADLHDGAIQSLVGTSMSLSGLAEAARARGEHELADEIDASARRLRAGVRDLRSVVIAMVPPRLHAGGLEAALADLLSPLEYRNVECHLNVDPGLDLSQDQERLIHRTALEALRNVARHAQATRVDIRVDAHGDAIRLSVRDDGRGFSTDHLAERRAHGHMGLTLLAQLTEDAGGWLDVSSSPDAGTELTAVIPR